MRRWIRWTGRAALIVVALMVVGLLALRFLVPAESLVDAAASRIRESTGVDVRYGAVSLKTWPRLALSLKDVTLEASDEGAGWSVDLAARGLEAGLAWRPLLRRRVELDRLVLDAPTVDVRTAGDEPAAVAGSAGAVPASSAAGETAAGKGAAVAMVLAGMSVRDGAFTWVRESDGRRVVLEGWNQDVDLGDLVFDDEGPAGAGPVTIPFDAAFERMVLEGFHERGAYDWRRASFAADVVWRPEGPSLTWEGGVLDWNGSRFAVDGVFELPDPSGELDLRWRLTELAADRLQRDLPAAVPQLPDTLAAWFAEAPVEPGTFTAEGEVRVPVPTPSGATAVELARGVAFTAASPDLVFTPPGRDERWTADARATLRDGRLEVIETTLRPVVGVIQGGLTMEPVGDPAAEVVFDADLSGVPVGVILGAVLPSAASLLQGEAGGEFSGGLTLGEPETIRSSLRVDGDALLTDGVVHAERLLSGLDPVLGDRLDLKRIDYASLSHRLRVEDGRCRIEDLAVEGGATRWTGEGWVGLDGGLDFDLTVLLPSGVSTSRGELDRLLDALRDEEGRVPLSFRLHGRAASPTVALETSILQESLQDEVEERLEDALQNELEGLLDKLK